MQAGCAVIGSGGGGGGPAEGRQLRRGSCEGRWRRSGGGGAAAEEAGGAGGMRMPRPVRPGDAQASCATILDLEV